MNSEFNPYRRWLGIASDDCPPDHYELLGLERFEARVDVIDSASIARIELLQDIASGSQNLDLSQQVLNEVSRARLCLLDANQREQYNLSLRKKTLGMSSAAERIAALGGADTRAGLSESLVGRKVRVVDLASGDRVSISKKRVGESSLEMAIGPVGEKRKRAAAGRVWALPVAATIVGGSIVIACLIFANAFWGE